MKSEKSKEINSRKMKKSKEIIVLEYAFLLEKRQKSSVFILEKWKCFVVFIPQPSPTFKNKSVSRNKP